MHFAFQPYAILHAQMAESASNPIDVNVAVQTRCITADQHATQVSPPPPPPLPNSVHPPDSKRLRLAAVLNLTANQMAAE